MQAHASDVNRAAVLVVSGVLNERVADCVVDAAPGVDVVVGFQNVLSRVVQISIPQ